MTDHTAKNNPRKHKNQLGFIDPTVAGIDIGAKLIHVSIPNNTGGTEVKEFGTTTPELQRLAKELKKARVVTAVMEATGVYWIPLYEILEALGFKPVLVDAKSVKNVPGRKTDVQDCQWIQTLYSNGLLRPAFRPPRDRLKLRSYMRCRSGVIKTRQYALLHMEKAMQLMNIKLSSSVSDIGGISGMDIMRAIVNGERDPAKLAGLRRKNCKQSQKVFEEALTGNFQEEHIFGLQQALELYDFANKQIEECDRKIAAELESYPTITNEPVHKRDKDKQSDGKYTAARKPKKNDLSFDARELLWQKSGIDLTALPGIQASTALLIFAELGGTDMSAWESAKEFASWLKLCPGNNISGGKRRKSQRQPCANYITKALRMAAMSAKKSSSSIGACIRRISGKKDNLKAIKAGAHKLADMIYHMCKEGWKYHEKGEEAYEKAYELRNLRSLEKRAQALGYKLVAIG